MNALTVEPSIPPPYDRSDGSGHVVMEGWLVVDNADSPGISTGVTVTYRVGKGIQWGNDPSGL